MAAKILVIEDEQLIADDLRETLECLGYEVPLPICSGEEALAQVAAIRPDLVLMDIQLGGAVDGVEASQQIQALYDIPVIFLTANADQATLERVKATHPFGYLLKPYDEKVLSTSIEIALTRHQTEANVRQALSTSEASRLAAESQNRQKSEYLAMTAHEFRNPLTAIQFATEMLQARGESLPQQKKEKHFQRIQSAANSLNEILDQMLVMGQADVGMCYEPAPINIVSFCHDQVEAFQHTIGESPTLCLTTPDKPHIVSLDAKLLRLLLVNLLSNAVKYSPGATTVNVMLRCRPDLIQLQVQDYGIGIPPEAEAQLFQPFQRANNVGQIPGTGLGLTIAKQCVDLHGGEIVVESQLGAGTTVSVTLPCTRVN